MRSSATTRITDEELRNDRLARLIRRHARALLDEVQTWPMPAPLDEWLELQTQQPEPHEMVPAG